MSLFTLASHQLAKLDRDLTPWPNSSSWRRRTSATPTRAYRRAT
ncbi:hypothetical protein [Streptomyces acidiscabies]|nr:hypothetical protein [Streptomyces acidiscabies]